MQNIDAHGPLCARLVLALCQSSLQRFMTLLVLEQELADLAGTCRAKGGVLGKRVRP